MSYCRDCETFFHANPVISGGRYLGPHPGPECLSLSGLVILITFAYISTKKSHVQEHGDSIGIPKIHFGDLNFIEAAKFGRSPFDTCDRLE